jgi:long-chain acyl-CoA synthetase
MAADRPYRWEKSYPPGVRWDGALATMTLGALIDRAAAYGPRIAIDYHDREISYGDLARSVDAVGAALVRRGLTGRSLALYLPNTPVHPIAFFAAAKAGARIVHLSPLDAERELAFKLRDSGARTLVTTNIGGMPAMAARLLAAGHLDQVFLGDEAAWGGAPAPASADARIVSLAQLIAEGAASPLPWPQVATDDVALIQYTGGTTGTPKGTMLSHGNLTAAVAMYDAWARGQGVLTPGEERAICVLPLFHIYALTVVLLRHLLHGNLILLRPRFDVEAVLRDIEIKRATLMNGVPTMWIALAAYPDIERRDLSALRQVSSGAAPLPLEVARRLERLTGHRLGGGWGMTETSPAGTSMPRDADRPGSIGLPLPGIVLEVVALDDPHRVLAQGETGELRIKGPNVTKGYWNRPQETASAFVDGFLLTGDVGRMDEDGYFYLVDRKKEMIISGGFNVYPHHVEDAIYEHPAVEEAVVIGIADAYRGEAAKAFVKLKAGAAPFTLEALRDFLGDKLGRHELPAALEFRTTLPRTAVGKLSRKELIEEERRKIAAPQPAGED